MLKLTESLGPCSIQLVEKLLLVSGAWELEQHKGLVFSDGGEVEIKPLGTGALQVNKLTVPCPVPGIWQFDSNLSFTTCVAWPSFLSPQYFVFSSVK